MDKIQITILYTPVLALTFAVLSLLVVFQRARNDVPFGDGGVPALRGAVRAHGNFAEYVPFAIVLIGLLELTGLAAVYIHVLFIALILSRVSHAIAMFSEVKTPVYFVTRIFGAAVTWLVTVACAVLLLTRTI